MLRSSILIFTLILVQAYSAPQLITFNEGKLGVNFGGYHAAVGLGGGVGNGGTAGGLFAEAGTPYGPAARAGLGGAVDGKSGTAGGLYAGATAGGNVNAAAGLGGAVGAGKAVGGGYSSAQAGSHSSSSVLEGDSDDHGSSEFSVSAVKVLTASKVPVEEGETVHKKVNSETNFDFANEIVPVANAGVEANVNANVNVNAQSDFVKEKRYYQPIWVGPQPYYYVHQVNVAPTPTQVIVHKRKPHRHHVHKTVYLGGYVGAGGEVDAPVSKTVTINTGQPINKRIDIEKEVGESGATINGQHVGPGKVTTFTSSKEVVVSNNPGKPNTFFQDIFNIPISTLKAVSGFLSNTAGSTNVSVQKSASVHADTDSIALKHAPSSSSSSSSEAHISVETPSASKFIGDIFAIPINTLSAVNKFLENNVPARKKVQVTADGVGEPTRIRLGPYARRRANKQVVIIQEPANSQPTSQELN